jgi:hypothetical protein
MTGAELLTALNFGREFCGCATPAPALTVNEFQGETLLRAGIERLS